MKHLLPLAIGTPRAPARLGTLLFPLLTLGVLAAGAACMRPAAAMAAPEPAPIPVRWQLDIETSPLRMALVETPGGASRSYFYMTYLVTNNGTSDILFAPAFELATDEGHLLRSGRGVPFEVTSAIMERLENPLLEDQISIVGNLLRGEENAKEGIAIWPVPTHHCNEVVVYAAGFSGETATVEIRNPETGENEQVLLRKTLMLRYRVPGELDSAFGRPLQPSETRWIMR